jgi:hypothetical protein
MDRFIIFITIVGAFWLLSDWASEVNPAPGVLAPSEPAQSTYRTARSVLPMQGWRLTPVADYRVTARVLEIEDYHSSAIDELIPLDFLLGWGPMSDSSNIDPLDLRISDRYATWRWYGPHPVDRGTMNDHMANHHLIPLNEVIQRQLESVRVGHVVMLTGELVNVQDAAGTQHFRSSLSRSDSGPGACEVMLVKSVGIR